MSARRVQSDAKRIEDALPVAAAAEEFLAAVRDAVKFLAAIEKLRRDPENAPTAETIASRPLPGGDDARYSLVVHRNADDADDADGGVPFKRYTLTLANHIAAVRQAFHNAVRAFPGAARSTARPIAQAREAYKLAWRDARARDIADEEAFNNEAFVAYCQRREAEEVAKRALRRKIKRQKAQRARARATRAAARHV